MLPYSKPLVPVASESASKVEGSGLYDKGKISNLLLKLAYKKVNYDELSMYILWISSCLLE